MNQIIFPILKQLTCPNCGESYLRDIRLWNDRPYASCSEDCGAHWEVELHTIGGVTFTTEEMAEITRDLARIEEEARLEQEELDYLAYLDNRDLYGRWSGRY